MSKITGYGIYAGGGSASVVVDTNLDPTSPNPVTNAVLADTIGYKASYKYVNAKVNELQAEVEDCATEEYVDTQVTGAKSYTDTKIIEAKSYTDTKIVEAKSYTDTVASTKIGINQRGAANGVASLDNSGKVPLSQLPEIGGNNVQEFDSISAFPTTGAINTLYIAKDTNRTYRWSGSSYVLIVTNALTSTEITELTTSLDAGEFTFYLHDISSSGSETIVSSFIARKYMTWKEFVNSSYNVGNTFSIHDSNQTVLSNTARVITAPKLDYKLQAHAEDVLCYTDIYRIHEAY